VSSCVSAPSTALRPFVEAYWQRKVETGAPTTMRVLPDASCDIIIELSGPLAGQAYVVGTQLRPIGVPLSAGTERVGMRFRLGMAGFVLGAALHQVRDRFAPLDAMSIPLSARLIEQLIAQRSLRARAPIIEGWLLARLAKLQPDQREVREASALQTMVRAGAGPRSIAAATGWNARRVQRVFRDRFGASVATLKRWRRFQLALERLEAGAFATHAAAAFELGFADEAHMCREFQVFAGASPSALLAERADVGNVQAARTPDG